MARKRIMEIKGIPPKLITAGHIKVGQKGDKKISSEGNEFRQPETLKYFKLTTTERGEDENLIEDIGLTEELKASGQCLLDKDGNIVGIPVRFLYDDINLNFPNRMASYKGGNLICEGNNEKSWNRIDDFKEEKPCPCGKFDSEYTGKDKCKYAGTLTMMLDAATLFGQTHKFTTTGKNSVEGLVSGIKLIMSATQGKIAGLPLMLTLNNLTTKTPTGYTTTVPVVGICYRGNALQLRDEVRNLIANDNQFQLDMKQIELNAYDAGGGVVVDDEIEFQKEFHPDSAQYIKEETVVEIAGKDLEVLGEEIKTVFSPETNTSDDDEDEENSLSDEQKNAKIIEQEKLILRLKKMLDESKAVSLMKRLNTKFLIQYLQDFFPVSMPVEKQKKPVYVKIAMDFIGSHLWKTKTDKFIKNYSEKIELDEGAAGPIKQEKVDVSKENSEDETTHPFLAKLDKMGANQVAIKDAIRAEFPEHPLNGTLSPSLLIAEAKKLIEKRDSEKNDGKSDVIPQVFTEETKTAHQETTSEPDKPVEKTVDDSGFKYDDNLRYHAEKDDPICVRTDLVQCALKKKDKKIDDQLWKGLVGRFTDSAGTKIEKAIQLTTKQVSFILELIEDDIPF